MKSFILRSIRTKITKILRFALFHCEYDGRNLRIFSVQNLKFMAWKSGRVFFWQISCLGEKVKDDIEGEGGDNSDKD